MGTKTTRQSGSKGHIAKDRGQRSICVASDLLADDAAIGAAVTEGQER